MFVYLQKVFVHIIFDALISAGGNEEPCVITHMESSAFDDIKTNTAFAKPLLEFLMAKFNLPGER